MNQHRLMGEFPKISIYYKIIYIYIIMWVIAVYSVQGWKLEKAIYHIEGRNACSGKAVSLNEDVVEQSCSKVVNCSESFWPGESLSDTKVLRLLNNVPIWFNVVAQASTTSLTVSMHQIKAGKCTIYMGGFVLFELLSCRCLPLLYSPHEWLQLHVPGQWICCKWHVVS